MYETNHVTALDGVSFVIDKGEFVFVVGASGSGKSTIIRLLLKELEPSGGRILVGGRDLTRLKQSKVPLLRRNVGRYLIAAGAMVALLAFGGVFIAGADIPWIVYTMPVLPVASAVLALLPATRRWATAG